MEPDFQGWATRAGLRCTDGRIIMAGAFAHQDKMQVPLVWQHGHNDPENVLGHAILEHRPEGVYTYGYFNKSAKAEHTRASVEHGDINALSIWANQLQETAKQVMHGVIREVSLVLSGANPGALIEHVSIRHSDDTVTTLDDEVIIHTGLELEHADTNDGDETIQDETVQDVYDSMNDDQKQVLHYMIGQALVADGTDDGADADMAHADGDEGETVKDVYDSMSEKQKQVLHYMIGQALETAGSAKHDNVDDDNSINDNGLDEGNTNLKGSDDMGTAVSHNVFESGSASRSPKHVLSHSDIEAIVKDAEKQGTLSAAVADYGLKHNIDNIDILFPEAQNITNTPEFLSRRVEWVSELLGGVRKSPFSRIKTMSADITLDSARAKGYIKGNLKKEEFFSVAKRVTNPTTIYKKQKLDRDDIIDITDFDVVVWLKGEMRLMLDEEIARAILVGDGREFDDDDKINAESIRPVATDHELFTTQINVNVDDANSTPSEIVDAISANRHYYKGTGQPVMYTTELWISKLVLQRDTVGRRLYKNLEELAAELRVAKIVPVEVLESDPTLIAIMFSPSDYVVGTTLGGQVSMFDDFDIDYNQHKYLIETRMSGALVKLKSALVVRSVAGTKILATPAAPTFDGESVTIVDTTGVIYTNADGDTVMNAAGSPYEVDPGDTIVVEAAPAATHYFSSSEGDTWTFTNE